MITDESKNHILVASRGNFYVFPVFSEDGKILKPEEILACFQYILNSKDPEPEFPLGNYLVLFYVCSLYDSRL